MQLGYLMYGNVQHPEDDWHLEFLKCNMCQQGSIVCRILYVNINCEAI
jgi:hypothetical protein